MTPSDWIGIAAIGVTVYLAQRAANSNLTDTIRTMFTDRLENIEADNILRDQWIDEIDKKVNHVTGDFMAFKGESSGELKAVAARVDKVERICDRRHEPRFSPGT